MAVSKRTRFEVLKRDNNTCRYCHAQDQPLTIDHVLPVALGGSDKPENLVAACRDCNAGKSSTGPSEALVADVSADALRWRSALEGAMRDAATEVEAREAYRNAFLRVWKKHDRRCVLLDPSWYSSLGKWHDTGVPLALVIEAASIAFSTSKISNQDVWRYTCGIVWRRLDDAREAVATPTPQPCGHCMDCRQPDNPWAEECYRFRPEPVLDDDEEPDVCHVCGQRDCMFRLGFEDGHAAGWQQGYARGEQRFIARDNWSLLLEHVVDVRGRG